MRLPDPTSGLLASPTHRAFRVGSPSSHGGSPRGRQRKCCVRHGLGGSLGAGYKEAREACGEQRLYQSSLSAQSHLPQGFPTHREKHNQGPECSWALLRGGWSSRQEVQVARRSTSLLAYLGGRLGKSLPPSHPAPL